MHGAGDGEPDMTRMYVHREKDVRGDIHHSS